LVSGFPLAPNYSQPYICNLCISQLIKQLFHTNYISFTSQFESCVFCRQTFLSVLLRRALPIFVICHVFVMSVVQLHQSVILVFRQGCRHQKESYLCSWPIWSPQHQYIQKLKCMLFSHSNQKDRKYIISFLVNYVYASSLRHMMFSTEKNKIFTLWQAFLVAKDFGARPAYYFALHHPSRTCGVMCLGIPFLHGSSSFTNLPEGFYILRWREPGRAESDFGRYDVKRVVRTIYILFSRSEIPIAKEDQEIMDLADLSTPLPEWFTEDDLVVYASLYEKSGFRYPLEMPYR